MAGGCSPQVALMSHRNGTPPCGDERRFLFSRSAGASKRRTSTSSIHHRQEVPRSCPGGEASGVLIGCSLYSRQCNNPEVRRLWLALLLCSEWQDNVFSHPFKIEYLVG